jgi:hypothetical protein
MMEGRCRMTILAAERWADFNNLLSTSGRSPEIPDSSDVYGWLIGSWELDVLHYKAKDISGRALKGEAHFGWVLEGRAIQDVWIMPRVPDRAEHEEREMNMYGTTLRIWNPAIQAWDIRWFNPVTNHYETQIGRRMGNEIVQIGARADGTASRWRFTEMSDDSFHWIGEALNADGKTWRLEGEFLAKRIHR